MPQPMRKSKNHVVIDQKVHTSIEKAERDVLFSPIRKDPKPLKIADTAASQLGTQSQRLCPGNVLVVAIDFRVDKGDLPQRVAIPTGRSGECPAVEPFPAVDEINTGFGSAHRKVGPAAGYRHSEFDRRSRAQATLLRKLIFQTQPQVFRGRQVSVFVVLLPGVVITQAHLRPLADAEPKEHFRRFVRVLNFLALRLEHVKKSILQLPYASPHHNGRLGKVMPLGLDRFFPRVRRFLSLIPGLAQPITRRSRLPRRIRQRFFGLRPPRWHHAQRPRRFIPQQLVAGNENDACHQPVGLGGR